MSEKYKVLENTLPHFITITITNWIDLLTRPVYIEILYDSLRFCQQNKGLKIHAYVFMTNHIHLIVSSNNDVSAIIRDFKRFTSRELLKVIVDQNESRKEWMLKLFKEEAEKVKRVHQYKLWRDGFHPVVLDTNEKIDERLKYIHENPIKQGLVAVEEHWVNSSVHDYNGEKGEVEVECLW